MKSPANKKEEARAAHQKFHTADGDLITMLNAYKAYRKANGDRNWAHQNFMSPRHLTSVTDVRKQLREIFMSLKLNLCTDSSKTTAAVRESFARGMFMNVAELKPDGRYQEFGQNLNGKYNFYCPRQHVMRKNDRLFYLHKKSGKVKRSFAS